MFAVADIHVTAERIVQPLDPRFERDDDRANHQADEYTQLAEAAEHARTVELRTDRRQR